MEVAGLAFPPLLVVMIRFRHPDGHHETLGEIPTSEHGFAAKVGIPLPAAGQALICGIGNPVGYVCRAFTVTPATDRDGDAGSGVRWQVAHRHHQRLRL